MCDENYDEISEIIDRSINNTSIGKLRQKCLEDISNKKWLADHGARVLTVLDTFDPVGENIESDRY